MKEIKRGEIYAVDFGAGFGSEQGGIRPVGVTMMSDNRRK